MSVASMISPGSCTSSGSSGSRMKSRRYRVTSNTSQVDETLFGNRSSSAPRERNSNTKFGNDFRSNSAPKKQEVIQIITKDMIRKLRVPREDPSGQSLIVPSEEFNRIRSAARVLTKREREEVSEQIKNEKRCLQEESESRKQHMQAMEMNRRQNEKLTDLEQEAKEKAQYMLQKAQEQMEEQEDEIKQLNEVILNAKCHAIRDAQLIEKREIKSEMLEEDKRLDELMESDRVRAIAEYEQRDYAKRLERRQGALVLHQQIDENEQSRLLEQEKKDQETRAMLRYLDKLKIEDMDALIKKKETQRTVFEDVAKANEEVRRTKDNQKEREKMEDRRVMQYLKEKEERELAFDKEKEHQRIEKEKEIARLRALQERAKDEQAEKDALRARRSQEKAEREWRRKQKGDAEKRALNEQNLRDARLEQVSNKEHFLAVQAARDRAEFDRVLNAQFEQTKKEEQLQEEIQKQRVVYVEGVRSQIKEKEKDRIQARQGFFQEGIKLDQEAKERRQKLDEIKRRKLKELEQAGVPIKYVNEVARRIEAPASPFADM